MTCVVQECECARASTHDCRLPKNVSSSGCILTKKIVVPTPAERTDFEKQRTD